MKELGRSSDGEKVIVEMSMGEFGGMLNLANTVRGIVTTSRTSPYLKEDVDLSFIIDVFGDVHYFTEMLLRTAETAAQLREGYLRKGMFDDDNL